MMVGISQPMALLKQQLAAVAPRDVTVLLRGESGAGKELTARTLHAQSRRGQGPFIAVDCTGLRDTLLESQLFGHVKGAFTGADQAALGFVRAADGGTLFLDEIGEMELRTQAKLLRVIQERVVVPLGSVKAIPVDVRIICATHRDLRAMATRGEFREDLLFRLDVVTIKLPSLRQRREDILPLAGHFLNQIAELYGEAPKVLSPETCDLLERFDWPGNVRELANAIEHAVVFSSGGVIEPSHLPDRITLAMAKADLQGKIDHQLHAATNLPAMIGHLDHAQDLLTESLPTLEQMERSLIERALKMTGGNQNRAAAMLKIERRRLYRKVAGYGLEHLTRRIGDDRLANAPDCEDGQDGSRAVAAS
jgi:DNA-binding NtrC family response regulator